MTVTSRTDGVVGHPDRHDADGGGAHGWLREGTSLDTSGSPDGGEPPSRPSRDVLTSQLYDQGLADPYDDGLDDIPTGSAPAEEPEPADPFAARTAARDGDDALQSDGYEAAARGGYDAVRADLYEAAARGGYDAVRADLYEAAARGGDDAGRADLYEAVARDGRDAVRADPYEAAARAGRDGAHGDLYDAATDYVALADFGGVPAPDPCAAAPERIHSASSPFVAGAARARRRVVSKIPVSRSDPAPTSDRAGSAPGVAPAPGPQIPPVPGAAIARRIESVARAGTDAATPKGRRVGSSHLPLQLRQRRARLSVFVVLGVTAGLTVLALLTARTPAAPVTSSVPTTPVSVATSPRVGVGTAGLAPSIEPPPGPAQFGTTLPPVASASP
jgi:hypothetical protein